MQTSPGRVVLTVPRVTAYRTLEIVGIQLSSGPPLFPFYISIIDITGSL